MEFYFYCSYENSLRGFFPTYYNGQSLVPADGSVQVKMPEPVYDFFSYDRFKILWREFPTDNNRVLFPEPGYSFFGIRGINCILSGKNGVINFAVIANEDEAAKLTNFAASVMIFYNDFIHGLPSFLSVGGDCGYDISAESFNSYILSMCADKDWKSLPSNDPAVKFIKDVCRRSGGIFTAKDLIRFAVATDDWNNISPSFGNGFIWRKKPKSVISVSDFEKIFIK
ncbi:MAG: hypothetical protein II998_11745 [Clostridia bacterium]|nr:hypothetical protein [Clostridia bacterium]